MVSLVLVNVLERRLLNEVSSFIQFTRKNMQRSDFAYIDVT